MSITLVFSMIFMVEGPNYLYNKKEDRVVSQQPQIHSKDERNDGGLRVYCARLQIRIGGRVKEDACVCD